MTWKQQSQISLDLFCYLLRWGMNEGNVLNFDLPGWYFYPLDKRGMHCAWFHTPGDKKVKVLYRIWVTWLAVILINMSVYSSGCPDMDKEMIPKFSTKDEEVDYWKSQALKYKKR